MRTKSLGALLGRSEAIQIGVDLMPSRLKLCLIILCTQLVGAQSVPGPSPDADKKPGSIAGTVRSDSDRNGRDAIPAKTLPYHSLHPVGRCAECSGAFAGCGQKAWEHCWDGPKRFRSEWT